MQNGVQMKTRGIHTYHQRAAAGSRGGVVLLSVMLLVALLSIVVVLLLQQSSHNRNRARSFLDAARAEMLVDVATQEVMAKLMDGGEIPWENGKATASMTAGPGMMQVRYYNEKPNRGYQTGTKAFSDKNSFCRNPFAAEYERSAAGDWQPSNPRLINLFSKRWYAPAIRYMTIREGVVNPGSGNPDYNPARVFNINTPENPFFPGELYLSGAAGAAVAVKDARSTRSGQGAIPTRANQNDYRFRWGEVAADRPVWVQWLPIYKYPNNPPAFSDQAGNTVRNPLVGRYCYWVDVENTKVNLKTSDRLYEESDLYSLLGIPDVDNTNIPDNDAYVFYQRVADHEHNKLCDAVHLRYELEKSQISYRTLESGPNQGGPQTHKNFCEGRLETDEGNNDAAVTYFSKWFDWRPAVQRPELGTTIDGRPYAADTSMVDWRTFTGIRPGAGGLGQSVSIEGLLNQAAQSPDLARFNTLAEGFSLLDPKAEMQSEFLGKTALSAMRRTYGNAVTLFGWDEERDPLGRPKIDINKFLHEYQNLGGPGGPVFNELVMRLNDPDYYSAYYPDAYPNGGQNISFAQMLNPTCGTSDPNQDANGQAAVQQMLVNIGEYGMHPDQPPYIDHGNGIVGARSMPYVYEVATRARPGLWDVADREGEKIFDDIENLIDATRIDHEAITNLINWTDTDGNHNFEYYLTNAVIDLCFGMVNPNPFAAETSDPSERRNHHFKGTLELDLAWEGGFQEATFPETKNGAQTPTADLDGLYVARPMPIQVGNGAERPSGRFWASGDTPYIRLGVIPGEALIDPAQVRCLKINGWKIKNESGQLYHQVPVKAPGQSDPARPWWAMAQGEQNVGDMRRRNSLYLYRHGAGLTGTGSVPPPAPLDQFDEVAVGWFTGRRIYDMAREYGAETITNIVFVESSAWATLQDQLSSSNQTERVAAADKLQVVIDRMRDKAAMVERVMAKDPTVGHRTGHNGGIRPHIYTRYGTSSKPYDQYPIARPQGHFYGANGHPWRRLPAVATTTYREVIEEKKIYGARPPLQVTSFDVRIPAGNTFMVVPRQIIIQPPAPVIGVETSIVLKAVTDDLDSTLTVNFNNPRIRAHRQESMGKNAHDLQLKVDKNNSAQGALAVIEWDPGSGDGRTRLRDIESDNNFVNSTYALFCNAARGDLMTSIGELGFVHSGIPSRPIDFSVGRQGKNPGSSSLSNFGGVNSSRHQWLYLHMPKAGPGMQMILDLFTPGAFRDNESYRVYAENEWRSLTGGYRSNSPANPRRGTWNVNAVIGQDSYLAVREGGATQMKNNKGLTSLATAPLHPYWVPSPFCVRGRATPDENGKLTKDDFKRNLDPNMSPFARYRRGWESWISVIGGDYSPYRTKGFGPWRIWSRYDANESYYGLLSAPSFNWHGGPGVTTGDPGNDGDMYNTMYAEFDPNYGGASKLLTKGGLAGDFPHSSPYFQYQGERPSADANSPQNPTGAADLYTMARFDVYPARHHVSEIIRAQTSKRVNLNSIATSLNPWWTSAALKRNKQQDPQQQGHAGRYRESGIFANAPVALVANQISTSANVFTIHVVAQALNDNGKPRSDKGTPSQNVNTGTGFMDATDEVTAEHWARVVVAKVSDRSGNPLPDPYTNGPRNEYKILYSTVRENVR